MSKVGKWTMEERCECIEKNIDMPDKAIKLFGKTIFLPVYLHPINEARPDKAMNATCPTDFPFADAPIFLQEQAQFPPSSQEDENLPSLADEARSCASSNSGCDEDKRADSFAADDLLAAPEVTDDVKPVDESEEVPESDHDPPSSVSEERTRRRPDEAVPCPRCESMDTKFCYYNNYNLNQPRHYCKNCQRYWTAGGSLRNVPVGAGRRKNKHAPAYQQWHVLRADSMESAQPCLISCAFRQNMNIPLDLDLLRTAPIGLPSVFKQNKTCLLSNSSESTVSNIHQKDDSGQPSVASGQQELQNPYHSKGLKTNLKDDAGNDGWPGASPVSPLSGPWPLLCNMRWINSSAATGAAVSPIPAAMATGLAKMQMFGKHPRIDSSKEGETTKSLWVPKTLRLTDPGEEARSSIMAILAAAKNPESITSGNMFKGFQSKQASKSDKHSVNTLTSHPAAIAISTPLQESN